MATFLVGLTGGIGSGKTTVAEHFRTLGASIVDADVVAHALTQKNQPCFKAIVKHFGSSILTATGELDRKRLREHIFHHPADKAWLEALLHPLIRERILAEAAQATAPYVILVIPLLAESKQPYPLQRILVIDTPIELQIQRSCQRDKLDESMIKRIIASQASREQRLAIADDVITNQDDLPSLHAQIQALHASYLRLAA